MTPASSSLVHVAIDEHIGTITLGRADALNAISGELAEELAAQLRKLAAEPEAWVVVLEASGEKAFCVGADLKERASFTLEDFYANREQIREMFAALRGLPQPTIASVFGFALGGGFELALSCDMVVASEDAVFGLPEVRVGLIPAGGGTQLLARKVGLARAKELIYRGRRFDAWEAQGMGLLARLVSRDRLHDETVEIARDICRSSPVAVREAKRALDAAFGLFDIGLEIEHDAWRRVIVTEDRGEGIAAFTEKREPNWRNR